MGSALFQFKELLALHEDQFEEIKLTIKSLALTTFDINKQGRFQPIECREIQDQMRTLYPHILNTAEKIEYVRRVARHYHNNSVVRREIAIRGKVAGPLGKGHNTASFSSSSNGSGATSSSWPQNLHITQETILSQVPRSQDSNVASASAHRQPASSSPSSECFERPRSVGFLSISPGSTDTNIPKSHQAPSFHAAIMDCSPRDCPTYTSLSAPTNPTAKIPSASQIRQQRFTHCPSSFIAAAIVRRIPVTQRLVPQSIPLQTLVFPREIMAIVITFRTPFTQLLILPRPILLQTLVLRVQVQFPTYAIFFTTVRHLLNTICSHLSNLGSNRRLY